MRHTGNKLVNYNKQPVKTTANVCCFLKQQNEKKTNKKNNKKTKKQKKQSKSMTLTPKYRPVCSDTSPSIN